MSGDDHERLARSMVHELTERGSSVRTDVGDPHSLRSAIRAESRRRGLTGTRTVVTNGTTVAAYNETIGYRQQRLRRTSPDPPPGSALDRLFGGGDPSPRAGRRTVIPWPGRRS